MPEQATSGAPLRDALLLAAEQEVDEHGVGAVSLRAIARRVGVSHQAPGHHFGDRSGLFTALAAKGFRTLRRRMLAARRRIPDEAAPAERVASLGIGYMAFAQQKPALFAVMFRPELHVADDPDLADARAGALAVLFDEVAAARATGWGRDHSETALALTCWSAVHGAVTLWREGTLDTFFPGLGSAQAVARMVTETLNAGLAAEAGDGGTSAASVPSRPIGHVESPLTDRSAAPRQGDEGAPDAWIVLDAAVLDGLRGIAVGDALLVLTWLDRARRDVLAVHPRDDRARPLQGVFSTRSPDRPNPIGLHRVEVAEIAGDRLRVRHLEALDGTPVLDLKPVLSAEVGER